MALRAITIGDHKDARKEVARQKWEEIKELGLSQDVAAKILSEQIQDWAVVDFLYSRPGRLWLTKRCADKDVSLNELEKMVIEQPPDWLAWWQTYFPNPVKAGDSK